MNGTLVYDDTKVTATIGRIKGLNSELHSVGDVLSAAISQLTSATGFGLLGCSISAADAANAVSACESANNSLINMCRSMQTEILMYDGNDTAIKSFLSTLSKEEIANAPQELKDAYSKLIKTSTPWYDRVGATILTGGISLVEGVLDFGETLIDLGDILQTGAKTIFTGSYDAINKLLGKETTLTKDMWEDTKARVSDKKVESIFNSFYDETEVGQNIKNKAILFDQVRSISSGIAQTVGITSLGILTCGASMGAVGSLSATRLATIAGTVALSSNTEDAWANGASVTEGLKRGVAGAVWDGAQWYVGAKIGAEGGFGDQLANKIFKGSANKAQISATRIALDAVDSGLEGYVQPALDLMYKDSYFNDAGEEVVFAPNTSVIDKYRELYDDAGGFGNVLVQAGIGAGGSAIGEITDAVKLLKPETPKANVDANAAAMTVGTSLAAKAKSIFGGKSETDIDITSSKLTQDVELGRPDLDTDIQYRRQTPQLESGKIDVDASTRVFEADASTKRVDIEPSTKRVDTDVTVKPDVEVRTKTDIDGDTSSTKVFETDPSTKRTDIDTDATVKPDAEVRTKTDIDGDTSSTKVFETDPSKKKMEYESQNVKQETKNDNIRTRQPAESSLTGMLDNLSKNPSETAIRNITEQTAKPDLTPKSEQYYSALATSLNSTNAPNIVKNMSSVDIQEIVVRNASNPQTITAIATNITGVQLNDTLQTLYRHNDATHTQIATSLISSVPPQNLGTMIRNGEIRYNNDLPIPVRTEVIKSISAKSEGFFAKMQNGKNSYGADQNATRKHVAYEVQRTWLADEADFARFIQKEYNIPIEGASNVAHLLAEPGIKMSIDEHNLVAKYLSQNLDYDAETLTQIQRYGFVRKNDIRYEIAYEKLVSTGTSPVTATRMLDSINTTGTCSYATVTNLIIDRYKDCPDLFEKDFGFKLYIEVDGKTEINTTGIMADMYAYVNSDACKGGSLFRYENGKYTLQKPNFDTANQAYLTSRKGLEPQFLQYLQSKNSSIRVETSSTNYTPSISAMYPPTADELKQIIATSLERGEQIALGLEQIPTKEFKFRDATGRLCESSGSWNEGGAHAVYVTGMTDKAVIVSTWGEKRYILFKDFEDNQYNISTTKISGIDGKTDTNLSAAHGASQTGYANNSSFEQSNYHHQQPNQTAKAIIPEEAYYNNKPSGTAEFKEARATIEGMSRDKIATVQETRVELENPTGYKTERVTKEYTNFVANEISTAKKIGETPDGIKGYVESGEYIGTGKSARYKTGPTKMVSEMTTQELVEKMNFMTPTEFETLIDGVDVESFDFRSKTTSLPSDYGRNIEGARVVSYPYGKEGRTVTIYEPNKRTSYSVATARGETKIYTTITEMTDEGLYFSRNGEVGFIKRSDIVEYYEQNSRAAYNTGEKEYPGWHFESYEEAVDSLLDSPPMSTHTLSSKVIPIETTGELEAPNCNTVNEVHRKGLSAYLEERRYQQPEGKITTYGNAESPSHSQSDYYAYEPKQTATNQTATVGSARQIYDTKLTQQEKIATATAKKAIISDLTQTGRITSETRKILTNLDAPSTAALLENSVSAKKFTNVTTEILINIDQNKIPDVIKYIEGTPSAKEVIEQLKPQQVASCLVSYIDSPNTFETLVSNLSDTQLAKALNGLKYDTTPTGFQNMSRILSQIDSTRIKNLTTSGLLRFESNNVLNTTTISPELKPIVDRINQDYRSQTKNISYETEMEIRKLDTSSTVKLLEATISSKSNRALIDVLDSLSHNQLAEAMKTMKTSPNYSHVISQLKSTQIEDIIKEYRGSPADLKTFTDNLSESQASSALKTLVANRRPPSYEVVEMLMHRIDDKSMAKIIDNGLLDKYIKTLTPEQISSGPLKQYTLAKNGKVAILTSKQMDQFKKIVSTDVTSPEFKKLITTADDRTLASILSVTNNPTTQQRIIDNMSPRKATDVIKMMGEKTPKELGEMVKNISGSDRVKLLDLITTNKDEINHKSVEIILTQLDESEIVKLIQTNPKALRNYVDSLSTTSRNKSVLSNYTVEIFTNHTQHSQRKYLLMTPSQQKLYQDTITNINRYIAGDSSISPVQIAQTIKTSPTSVTIKVLEQVSLDSSPKSIKLLNDIYANVYNSNPNIIEKIIDIDYNGAGKIISALNPTNLKSTLGNFIGEQRIFDAILRNTPSDHIIRIANMSPSSQLTAQINKTIDIKFISSIKHQLSTGQLRSTLETYSDRSLANIIERTLSQKTSDASQLGARIIQEISPERLTKMVENSTLKYNANLPESLRLQIESKFTSERNGFFTAHNTGRATYGIDQAISGKHISYIVQDNFLEYANRTSMISFLQNEKNYTSIEAQSIFDRIRKAPSLTIKEYKLVSEYLAKDMSYSPERVAMIKRRCFKLETNSQYDRMLNRLTSSGISNIQARRMIDCINVDRGACSYADVANVIAHSYRNNPAQFEQDFGFPLYVEYEGKRRINSEELLLDMFTTINSDKCGGTLFRDVNGHLVPTSLDVSAENQQYLSDSVHGIKEQLIDRYLKTKNPNLSFQRNLQVYNHLDPMLKRPIPKDVITSIGRALQEGKEVSLGVCKTANREFAFYKDGIRGGYERALTTNTWKEGNGHAMYVVGMTDDHLIISTWGQKMYIPLSNLSENCFTISISTIGGIK